MTEDAIRPCAWWTRAAALARDVPHLRRTGEVPVEELYDPADAGANPARWLLGQLWNCTDTIPHLSCGDIGIERGSTYAVGARALMAELNGSTESQ